MTRQFSRSTAVVALSASALVLAACHPPHQQPSDVKIDTASSVAAPTPAANANDNGDAAHGGNDSGLPSLNVCGSDLGVRPATVPVDCASDVRELTNIDWLAWDAFAAEGEGTLQDANGTVRDNVTIVLSEPETDPATGELSFSDLEIDDASTATGTGTGTGTGAQSQQGNAN